MKRCLLIICLLLCCSPAFAGGRGGVRIGMDWGYGLGMYSYWNLIYLDSEMGYVVQDQDSEMPANPYAFCTVSLGFEPTSRMGPPTTDTCCIVQPTPAILPPTPLLKQLIGFAR